MDHTYPTQYVKLSGGTIAYDDTQGEGQVVLCLPLMGDVRQVYRFTRENLVKAGYRVITMDLRGLGESSTNWGDYTVPAMGSDVIGLVEHLKLKNVILIGESISAGTAIWAAAEKPEYFSGLVLTGPFMRVLPISKFMKVAKKIVGLTPSFWKPFYKSLYPTHKPADFDTYLDKLMQNIRQPGRYAATVGMMDATHNETEKHYSKLQAPAIVIMGSKDPDFKDPAAEAEICANKIGAQKVIIKDGGHILPAEFPDEFSQQVITFIKGIAK